MKPIKIVMSAFGSYAGEEEIDFSDIQQGIFLITGDTGAGKTTIFDAVTYALYGVTSGNRRTGKMMGSQFALSKAKTYVDYTFEEDGKRYQVIRRPDIAGQTGKVELILPDGTVFPGKVKETNKRLEEIIGLDIEQFCQVAMIAQGDFRELLLASSNERKAIFEKIFGTESYDRVQVQLHDLCKKLYGKQADLQKFSERELEGIQVPLESAFAEEWEERKKVGLSEISNEELFQFLEKLILEEQQQENTFSQQKEQLEEQLRKLHERIAEGKAIEELRESLRQATKNAERLLAQKEQFEEIAKKCQAARSALLVDDKARQISEKNTQFQKLTAEIQSLEQKIADFRQKKELEEQRLQEALSRKEEQMPMLQQEKVSLETSMPYYEQLAVKKVELEKQLLQKKRLKKQEGQLRQTVEERKEVLKRVQELQVNLEGCIDTYYQIRDSYAKNVQKRDCFEQICGKQRDWQQRKDASAQEKMRLVSDLEAHRKAVWEYQEAYQAFIAEQAGFMAADLQEDMPCPVCGSLHHPKKAILSGNAVTQLETEQRKQWMEKLEKQLEQQKEACQEKERELAALEAELKADLQNMGSRELLSDCKEVFLADFWKKLQKQLEDWKGLCVTEQRQLKQAELQKQQYEEAQKQQKQLEQQSQADLETLSAVTQQLEQQNLICMKYETEIQSQQKQLAYESQQMAQQRLQSVSDQMLLLEQAFEKSQQNFTKITNQLQEVQGRYQACLEQKGQVKEQLSQAYQSFLVRLKEVGFADQQAYLNSRMKQEKIEQLEQECNAYAKQCMQIQSEKEAYTAQLKGKQQEDLGVLQEEERLLLKQRTELERQEKELFSILDQNQARLSDLRRLLKDYEQVKAEYRVVYHLNRTANGKLDLKLDFQTYMLRHYFEEIIHEANKRLRIMSRDQFILQCRSYENFSGNAAAGLDLDVYSLVTGKTRDIKTLSGGESFMAALAMALGMADMIQSRAGKVHLDTMFIDEGFGSLDDQSREDAVRVLNELAGQKRLIGIISHVTELKEQIDQKLIVTRDEKGSHAHWEI